MNFLDKYPEILTVKQIAEILKVKVNMVYGLCGLDRIRIGKGKGKGLIRYKKNDLISYIDSRKEEVVNFDANKKTQRHQKMGLPDMLSWKEVQAIRMEHQR